MPRLLDVQWLGPAVCDVAKRAATGAQIAHDHESGRAMIEAFGEVGARSLFAHGMQLLLTEQLLDAPDAGP